MGCVVGVLAFPHPPRSDSANRLRNCDKLVWLQTRTGGKTPAVYFQQPGAKFTLLVCHGNAEDVGQSLEVLSKQASMCNASVFAVEYPGYSISEASAPSESLCYEAAEAAYTYLTQQRQVPPSCVVPFGRSLGSGPAVDVASKHPEIEKLVLVSPLESGARAFFNKTISCLSYPVDPFKNYKKINSVEAKTCIIHGTTDRVVPCHNGEGLHASLERRGKAATPLWIKGRGHNNMPENEVYRHVKEFLETPST